MVYIITLDSHEYIGMFANEAAAHAYAKRTNRNSYQIVHELPAYALALLQTV